MKKFLLFVCALMVSQIAGAWYLIGAGSLGNWDPNSAIASTSTEGSLEVWENINLTANQEFKFIKEKNWNTNLGSGSSISSTGQTTTLYSGGNNCKWTGAAGTYIIKLDATNNKLYIEAGKAEELVIPEGAFSFYEGEIVAFFINTTNWSKVNAYAWNASGNNSWPGQAMTVVDGVTINNKYNAYRWTSTMSGTPDNIIFNNGSSQTADLVFVNGGVYDGNGTLLTTITPTVAAEPTISLHYSPSEIYENTTVTLTSTVLDGEGMTVEYFVGSDKLAANTWTPTTAGEYTLTANLMNGSKIAATDSKVVTVKESTEFSVYLDKASTWTTTYIYCWGGYGNTWPGDKLTATEIINDTEFYKWTFKNIESVNIIFTDNAGNQTADITNVSETTYYRLTGKSGNPCGHESFDPVATPGTLVYNVTVPAGTPMCCIVGDFNQWDVAQAPFMTKIDDTHYTITIDNVTKAMEYKYTCGQSWNYVEQKADHSDTPNRTWSESDVVEAWLDMPSSTPDTIETLTYNVTVPIGTPACYIVGAYNGWSTAIATPMTKVSETVYTVTLDNVSKSMEYKYICGKDWEYVELQADRTDVPNRTWSESDVVAAWKSTPSQPEEPVYETLIYNVTVPFGTEACYIAGEMNGWTFSAMNRVDENHFTITLDNVAKSMQYKYTCGEDWEYVEMQIDGVTDVQNRTWNQYDTVDAWKNVWTSVGDITANNLKVYGAYNAIHVSSTQEVTLYIYNMQGMLVSSTVALGNMVIGIAPGMYIVNNNRVLVY